MITKDVNKKVKRFETPEKCRTFKSEYYNWILNEDTGTFARWGKNKEDDPLFSPFGPELVDMEISTVCNGPTGVPCPWCSPPGTLVNTPDGMIKIEDLKEGDFVIGFDVNDDSIRINSVKEPYSRNYKGELIDIETEDGKFISLTPNHNVSLSNGTWIPAGELKEGDDVVIF